MTTNKDKGTAWERTVLRCMRAFAPGVLRPFRPHNEGRRDAGDLQGLSPFLGQNKDWRSWESAIREGLDGAERQKLVAGEPYGVAFVKRARRSPGDAYAVMTLATFTRALLRLRRAELLLREVDPDAFAGHREVTEDDNARPFPSAAEGDRFAAQEEAA